MERSHFLHIPSVDQVFKESSDLCDDVRDEVSPSNMPPRSQCHAKDHSGRIDKWLTRLSEERRSRSHSSRSKECGKTHSHDKGENPA